MDFYHVDRVPYLATSLLPLSLSLFYINAQHWRWCDLDHTSPFTTSSSGVTTNQEPFLHTLHIPDLAAGMAGCSGHAGYTGCGYGHSGTIKERSKATLIDYPCLRPELSSNTRNMNVHLVMPKVWITVAWLQHSYLIKESIFNLKQECFAKKNHNQISFIRWFEFLDQIITKYYLNDDLGFLIRPGQ